jgi:hypothetical protein
MRKLAEPSILPWSRFILKVAEPTDHPYTGIIYKIHELGVIFLNAGIVFENGRFVVRTVDIQPKHIYNSNSSD